MKSKLNGGSGDSAAGRRPRAARGSVPRFFQDPMTDRLVTVVVALMGEVSVLRDRIDTHEQLAKQGRIATPEELERFVPDAPLQQARDEWRSDYVRRVFRALMQEAELAGAPGAESKRYALDEFTHPGTDEESREARAARSSAVQP